jgi:hypothetical protein
LVKHKLAPNVVFRTDSVEAVRSLVATGAVTILSDMVYRPWSLEGDKAGSREISQRVSDHGRRPPGPTPSCRHRRAFIEFCRMGSVRGTGSMTL